MQFVQEPEITPTLIRQRIERLRRRLREAAERAGRDPDGFAIVGVTKGFPVEACRMGLEAGLTRLGENRVQEALPKIEALADAEWHLIGRLQSNKVRKTVAAFSVIHSVDSLELLARLAVAAHDSGRQPALLLQVNATGEATKAGFPLPWFEAEVRRSGQLVEAMRSVRDARVTGLMAMAEFGVDETAARATFRRLRELRDALQQTAGQALSELSMGMTADAEAGVAEGATLVRIGTAIFGPRPG
jgi:pyridoxal phosphate enzyme (YggS family)